MKIKKNILPKLMLLTLTFASVFTSVKAKAAEIPSNIEQTNAYTNGALISWPEVEGTQVVYKIQYSTDKVNWIDTSEEYYLL